MPIPTAIESLSTTAASNGPAGSEQRTIADDGLRQAYAFIRQLVSLGSNIASAATITPPSTGSSFNITGVTTITAIASTNSWDGRIVTLIFAGVLQITHSANLALPGSTNITTAANDVAVFIQTGSGAWRLVAYRTAAADGYLPLLGGTITGNLTVNGNSALGNALGDTVSMYGSAIVNAAGNWTIPAPSSGATLTLAQFAGSAGLSLAQALSGSVAEYNILNTSNTAASDARIFVGTGGASGGDPHLIFNISGLTNWVAGIDNSDSDAFKISASAALGTTDCLRVSTTGDVAVIGSAGTLGYGTGSGGTVTQITSKTTTVVLNKGTGEIVMNNAALAANAEVNFTLTNSVIATNDVLIVHADAGATDGAYLIQCVQCGAGFAQISVRNLTAGSLSEAINLNFAVIKAAIS